MGSDGFQTQKKKSWVSGQVRAERVITIDGMKRVDAQIILFGVECVDESGVAGDVIITSRRGCMGSMSSSVIAVPAATYPGLYARSNT